MTRRRANWAGWSLAAVVASACATGVSAGHEPRPAEVAVVDLPDSSPTVEEDEPRGVGESDASAESKEPAAGSSLTELEADAGGALTGMSTLVGGTGLGTGRIGGSQDRDGGVPKLSSAGAQPSLDPAIIQRVIRQHISGFRACYEKALTKDPQLSTRVAPRFTIGVDGRVASVSLSSSSGDPALDSCIESVVKRLVFPKPKGGVVVVTYPFVFAPGN